MTSKTKAILCDNGARLLAVAPPVAATLHQFPLFVQKSSGATFSGICMLMLLVCMIPFWKKLKNLKEYLFSASTPVLWLVALGAFVVISEIATSIVYISIAGLGGSLASVSVSALGRKFQNQDGSK